MFKDFEMWNYSFPRPHYNWCINFKLKDWSLCHMAGRRITIDCILTKKKLEDNGATVLRKFSNTSSETHLWDGKGCVTLIWTQIWLILICICSNSKILSEFVYQIICFAILGARAVVISVNEYFLQKNLSFIYSPAKPVGSFLFFGTWNHFFK